MTDDSPYDILGVAPDAPHAEIRAAYRRLASAHHPDHDAALGSSDRMTRINHAWYVLGDAARRAEHDQRISTASPLRATMLPEPDATIVHQTTRHLRSLLVAAIVGVALVVPLFVVIAMAQSGAR